MFADMDTILSVKNLSAGYGKKQVLFDVNLDIIRGEVLLITGGNGSGKSTLLKAMFGLISPWDRRTQIRFRPDPKVSEMTTHLPSKNLQKGIAYLSQKNAVFNDLTVLEALRLTESTAACSYGFTERLDEVLTLIPALKPLLPQKPATMSGGERQLTALAILLLYRPRLLLLDEPLAGLDERQSGRIEEVLAELHTSQKVTLVIVEHRLLQNPTFIQREVAMNLGQLESVARTLVYAN